MCLRYSLVFVKHTGHRRCPENQLWGPPGSFSSFMRNSTAVQQGPGSGGGGGPRWPLCSLQMTCAEARGPRTAPAPSALGWGRARGWVPPLPAAHIFSSQVFAECRDSLSQDSMPACYLVTGFPVMKGCQAVTRVPWGRAQARSGPEAS